MTKYNYQSKSERGNLFYNLDELFVFKGEPGHKFRYFMLADGAGSSELSAEAAQIAIKEVDKKLQEGMKSVSKEEELSELVEEAIKLANEKIMENNKTRRKESPSLKPGASTIDVGILYKDKAHKTGLLYISHIGDSRIYIIDSSDEIKLITRDENSARVDFEGGYLENEEEIKVHPGRKKIKNVLGFKKIKINHYSWPIDDAKVILASTDGLYGCLTDEEIKQILKRDESPSMKLERLFRKAKNPAGIISIYKDYVKRKEGVELDDEEVRDELVDDNLTAIVINVEEE